MGWLAGLHVFDNRATNRQLLRVVVGNVVPAAAADDEGPAFGQKSGSSGMPR